MRSVADGMKDCRSLSRFEYEFIDKDEVRNTSVWMVWMVWMVLSYVVFELAQM